MKTPQILTGQQAIDQFGMHALIECSVAVTTELNGLGHSVMQIGVIADPDSCYIDEDDTGVLWVEYQVAYDWYLQSIPADQEFVLLDDKNQPESNAVLSERIAELTRQNSELLSKLHQLQGTMFVLTTDIIWVGESMRGGHSFISKAHKIKTELRESIQADQWEKLTGELRQQAKAGE
uniref:hypothetical protein n=1 Tax=Rheinheimera sp. TaxID=1869214 RepID=UPI0040489EAF